MKKKSFILYHDMRDQIDMLSDSQAGELIKMVFASESGDDVESSDPLVMFAFAGIKKMLDRNREAYRKTCEARAEAGKMGGLAKASKSKQKLAKASKRKQTLANLADSDSDSENDSVSETITPKPPRGIHSLHRRILLLFVSSVSDKPRPKAEMNAWNKIKDHVTEQDVESLERFYALPKSKDHDATWNRKTAAPQLMNQFTAQLEFAENYKVQSNSSYYDDSKIL